MIKRILRPADYTGLVVGAALLAALTGCIVGEADHHPRNHAQTQVSVVYQDDYDYYPGYEVYYSRSRHEYVYLDGNAWVRRPEPRGVSLNVLLAAPSVRMDFRDAPERHHPTVIRSYPKNWERSGPKPADKHEHRKNKKHDDKDDNDDRKKDRDDGNHG